MKQNFIELLENLNRGAFAADCTTSLNDLAAQIEATGKAGSITIKLDVLPEGDAMVTIVPHVSTKKPVKRKPPTVFFLKSGLHADDPDQLSMFDSDKVRPINSRSGEI